MLAILQIERKPDLVRTAKAGASCSAATALALAASAVEKVGAVGERLHGTCAGTGDWVGSIHTVCTRLHNICKHLQPGAAAGRGAKPAGGPLGAAFKIAEVGGLEKGSRRRWRWRTGCGWLSWWW